ncbi:MAG: glycoside hydrolase family 9 protein [Flavobacteriaceae bacterium]|nr:glycoside hydrolase family 9 protein [Flavobacteriaceae bacterium]
MKKICYFLILMPILFFGQTSDFIHIDQFGYKTNHSKVAVISNPQTGFNAGQSFTPSNTLEVRNTSTNAVVFSGNPTVWNSGTTHTQSGDKGWWFDFSNLTQNGDFYIYDATNNETSAIFTINDNVYNDLLITAGKVFYYNRCGIAKITPYALNGYTDAISFSQDAQARDIHQPDNTSTTKDMTGGWFDAGDYNKYVTFAETPIHNLLWAYSENPTIFGDNWNIPESGNNIPDIIDEIKWELDWLLKMINSDGSVHIKIGARNYNENNSSPPSINTDIRYYEQTCTSSAIAATSMLAHAAKVFSQFSSLNSYTLLLQNKAIQTWASVLPSLESNTLQENCDDQLVVAGDADVNATKQKQMAITAAIYLFDLTNDNQYQQYLIDYINDSDVINNGNWSNYNLTHIDALLHYTTLSNANTGLKNTIVNSANINATNNYNDYFEFNDLDLYRAYVNDWVYHWGSNIQKSNFGILNFILDKYQINTSASATQLVRAKEHLHYFHGVNPLGLVYLSNMNALGAEKSANQIYHNWFTDGNSLWDDVQNSTFGPAPGYVTGGSNVNYNANTSLSPPFNQPLQKSYLDFNTGFPDNSWEITEPSITNQAAYIRLLAQVISLDSVTLSLNEIDNEKPFYTLAPNPTIDVLKIISNKFEKITVSIYNLQGQLVKKSFNILTNESINISTLANGMYLIKVKSNNRIITLKFIKG